MAAWFPQNGSQASILFPKQLFFSIIHNWIFSTMNKKEMSADNSMIHIGIVFATEKNKLSGPFSDVHGRAVLQKQWEGHIYGGAGEGS